MTGPLATFTATGTAEYSNISEPAFQFGTQCLNGTYGPNSFTISGSNLTNADIIVGPLAGFSFSTTSGGTYSASLDLTQSGGTYSQIIYVQFSPTVAQAYDGNIPVSGGAASAINVAATGTGNTLAPVSVSIASDAPLNTICAGTLVTFTATPTNGGTPSYQWLLNGGNVGTNSATYTEQIGP